MLKWFDCWICCKTAPCQARRQKEDASDCLRACGEQPWTGGGEERMGAGRWSAEATFGTCVLKRLYMAIQCLCVRHMETPEVLKAPRSYVRSGAMSRVVAEVEACPGYEWGIAAHEVPSLQATRRTWSIGTKTKTQGMKWVQSQVAYWMWRLMVSCSGAVVRRTCRGWETIWKRGNHM